jgi:hypothetical protein
MNDIAAVFERLAEKAAETGARVALETLKREKAHQRDRRLRNTKLLLRNYRTLKLHITEAIYREDQLYENSVSSALEILYGIDDQDDERLYIEAINQSQKRTQIIIQHIDHMLYLYKAICENSKRPEDLRRYRVLHAMYIAPSPGSVSAEDVAGAESINTRTVYKDLDNASVTLSALFFGVDGLQLKR